MPRQKSVHHEEVNPPSYGPGSGHEAATDQDRRPDALDDPDPLRAADAAGTESLLRCWTRETDLPRPDGDTLRIAFPASGTALLVPVRYWSATGTHRFGAPALENAPAGAPPADAATVAVLIGREGGESGAGDLVARVADSVRHTAGFIDQRRRSPADPAEADLFLTAEQSLLLGHPLHPTPKSREGLSESESRRYSPELHGSFPLHWFAVDRSLIATDSAWTEGGPATADELLAPHAEGLKPPPAPSPCPCTPGRPPICSTAPRSVPSPRPGCSTTSAPTASTGTPPPPSAPCTGPGRG